MILTHQSHARFARLAAGAMVVALCLMPVISQASSGRIYLNWHNKPAQSAQQPADTAPSETAAQTAAMTGPSYPVPASPYGQVGDPYKRLSWPTKPTASAPAPVAQPQAVASIQPLPTRPSAPMAVPLPIARPQAPVVSDAQIKAAPKPAAPVKAPTVAPQASAAPTPVMAADQPYQVPATSKYAAQLKAARDAQARAEAKAQAQPQAAVTPAKPDTATAPLATTTDDGGHVFVPGEHYTDASQAPRLYSLHREYGLTPDPITVDHEASGAMLDTTLLDAEEAAKVEKQAKDTIGDTSSDTKTTSPAATDPKAKP